MASVDQSRENNMVTLAVISESSGRSARKERNAFYENWSDFFLLLLHFTNQKCCMQLVHISFTPLC